ncbi:class Ib ribonucleoside-diphosphate reductase assembly flavoprotein NrdI [Gottfriedia acidiceleris]|uniref:class Ib ribonucleoside-diphosphate reductase assembly flavoprotein NrdI n=1 Tax=Gottfriedia acidiceleris TaxID=371036 RepID=UPI003391E142
MIVFDSRTGNVKRFIKKLGVPAVQITPDMVMEQPFILVTFTTGNGQVPETTDSFLKINNSFLEGVASSGNRNWGENFAAAGRIISEQYKVPLIHQFELSGTRKDIQITKERIEEECPTLHLTMKLES